MTTDYNRNGCHTKMYLPSDGSAPKNIRILNRKGGGTLSLDSKGNLVAVDSITCDPGATICVGTDVEACK